MASMKPYKLKQTLTSHKRAISSTARTWRSSSDFDFVEFQGHEQGISNTAFSSDSHYLGIASCLKVFSAHFGLVTAVNFNRNSFLIILSNFDGLCWIWDASTGHCIKTLMLCLVGVFGMGFGKGMRNVILFMFGYNKKYMGKERG
ncbi:hypothetical protein CsSME_00023168 [Camellia sinensis var. sinensis]